MLTTNVYTVFGRSDDQKAIEELPEGRAALLAAWNHLDEPARGALVRTAEVMARG